MIKKFKRLLQDGGKCMTARRQETELPEKKENLKNPNFQLN